MSNILYIGPYKQNDEWGLNSKAFLGLLQTYYGSNVVSRPIWFTSEDRMHEGFHLLQCEQNKLNSFDVIIQHGLPNRLSYNGNFKKNIAVAKVDSRIKNTNWVDNLNLFDKIIVFSQYEKLMLEESNVVKPIMAFDFPPIFLSSNIQDFNLNFGKNTVFYTKGSLNEKDGIKEIMMAYLLSFSKLDNVLLLIVTDDKEAIEQEINKQKQLLGLYNPSNNDYYPNIGIINPLSDVILNYLHEKADYYIHTFYDSVPTQDLLKAIIFNHTPIVLDTCANIFDKEYDFIVSSIKAPCLLKNRPVSQICIGYNDCQCPNIKSLQNKMTLAYTSKNSKDKSIINTVINDIFTKPLEYIKHVCD